MIKFIAIIPARYASTRFPGKPLVEIDGKAMIQHVYERCSEVLENVYVATDDERIANAVECFGGRYIMTSPDHPSGTDRCAEAAKTLQSNVDFDVVINIQGDEPFLAKEQLIQIMTCFNDRETDIATLITPIKTYDVLFNPNKVKAVVSANGFALYFSRQAIPFQRDIPAEQWLGKHTYYLHLGMYAFRHEALQEIVDHKPSKLETAEKLEQLRWLENGYRIKTVVTLHQSAGVDTPEDLKALNKKPQVP